MAKSATEADYLDIAPSQPRRQPLFWRTLALLATALLAIWPALYNRYPLFYPDTLSYLDQGRPVAEALFLHRFTGFIGMRSELYALGIYPFHLNLTPWPILILHAAILLFTIALTVRSILPRETYSRFLLILALLSLLTSLSWYIALIMPDVLGGALYLCFYLIVFARNTLSRTEHWLVALIAWWSITAHSTHLLLALWILVLLAALLLFRSRIMQQRIRALAEVAILITLAALSQIALHAYLYGKPSLNGMRMPYVTARLVADGPARQYLQQHCPAEHWVLCAHLQSLPDNDDEFIWGDTTIWTISSPHDRQQILNEELPLALATLRTYPRQQLAISFSSFIDQLTDFGVNDFDNNTWMQSQMDATIPGSRAHYDRSAQARSLVPTNFFTKLQRWPVYAAILIVLASLPWLWRSRQTTLLGLIAVIVPTLVVNAFITAVLCEVDERYQARVIWLLPFVALLIAFAWYDARRQPTEPTR